MALAKLEEMGYKPRKREKEREKKPVEELSTNKTKQTLELLIEGFADPDPRELIIYGVYVKKHLAPFVPASREKRIEKTLEYLAKAIENLINMLQRT
jgi:hypothetical protein